jgi:hypothetical protein
MAGGKCVKIKKLAFPFGTVFGVVLLTAISGSTQAKPETKTPIITQGFAVDKGHYGYIWKIYVEAEDPFADMLKIASVVDQVGYGRYPTDWIFLKPKYQKHFRGYIQWNTFSSKTGYLKEWTHIALNVSVVDKDGNTSNEVIFPFTFERGVKGQPNPPPPFDQGDIPRLGYIHTNLFEPTNLGGGGRRK